VTQPHATMDPTFYRSPAEAIAAPTERLAYVVAFDRAGEKHDALAVVDTDPGSQTYGTVVGSGLEFEFRGDHDLRGVPGRWPLFALQS